MCSCCEHLLSCTVILCSFLYVLHFNNSYQKTDRYRVASVYSPNLILLSAEVLNVEILIPMPVFELLLYTHASMNKCVFLHLLKLHINVDLSTSFFNLFVLFHTTLCIIIVIRNTLEKKWLWDIYQHLYLWLTCLLLFGTISLKLLKRWLELGGGNHSTWRNLQKTDAIPPVKSLLFT